MTVLRVVVSSPSDVQAERGIVDQVVRELDFVFRKLLPERNVRLESFRWETDAYSRLDPSSNTGAQGVLDEQIAEYDVFIGIMWLRFGTPVRDAESGTEHEFNNAVRQFRERGSPDLMFYFSRATHPPLSESQHEQYGKVLAFRKRVEEMGLHRIYASSGEFEKILRQDMVNLLERKLASPSTVLPQRSLPIHQVSDESSRDQPSLASLVQEYGEVRAKMRPGDERTERLELIVARLKSIAPGIAAEFGRLSASDIAGERLAAVAIASSQPSEGALVWLAERFKHEKPFIAYHAGLALIEAARQLPIAVLPTIRTIISSAVDDLKSKHRGRVGALDRYRVLQNALHEVDRRMAATLAERDTIATAVTETHFIIRARDARTGMAIADVSVAAVTKNGTALLGTTDSLGEVRLEVAAEIPYDVLIAHERYIGMQLPAKMAPFVDEVRLTSYPEQGSAIGSRRFIRIPGLEGIVNLGYDTLNRPYLYAENVAVNDSPLQPVGFEIDQPLRLTDARNRSFEVIPRFVLGQTSLLDFRRI